MNTIKTLTALSIGLAAAVPAAYADRGDRYAAPDTRRNSGYERSYDRGYDDWRSARRHDDRRVVVRRDVVVERPVYVQPVPVYRQSYPRHYESRPVYVQPAPVYRQSYPRYYESRPVVNGGTVVGAIGGAVVGSMIGSQIGYGEYQGAATVAGAVIGGAIGSNW